jgi:hypothetical protein
MSELQEDTGIIENEMDNPVETETNDSIGAESATATGKSQDKKHDDGVQKAINKQHAKYREEERKRIQIEQEAAELRKQLEQVKAKEQDVTVPPIPDPYDDDYEEKIKARDEAIRNKAAIDGQRQFAEQQQQAAQRQALEAEQKRVEGLLGDFNSNTTKLGLNLDEVTQASNVVGSYGVNQDIANFLLGDEDGPLMVKYLAANPVELDEIRTMNPINAALKLNSQIREKAQTLKPQTSNAPDPVETLNGGGVPANGNFPLSKGAKFE